MSANRIDVRHTADPVRRRVRSRGVPPSLAGREVFYSEQPHEAAELIGRALGSCHLIVRSSREFAAVMHGAMIGDVSLLHLDLHVAAALDIGACGPYHSVLMSMGGNVRGTAGGHPVTIDAIHGLVTSPFTPVLLEFEHDSPLLIMRITEAAMEQYLTRQLGHIVEHPLVFAPVLELMSDAASRWHGALQVLHSEVILDGSLLNAGLGVAALEDFLMSSLLLMQPSNYHDALARPDPPIAGRRTVRRALEFIETHLADPVTMHLIADHVGSSVRSVQQGFHDELGTTPMNYVRERRLERAHDELAQATRAGGVTVTSVAEHWGFTHLSSFAGSYRKRWGETPSQTLRS